MWLHVKYKYVLWFTWVSLAFAVCCLVFMWIFCFSNDLINYWGVRCFMSHISVSMDRCPSLPAREEIFSCRSPWLIDILCYMSVCSAYDGIRLWRVEKFCSKWDESLLSWWRFNLHTHLINDSFWTMQVQKWRNIYWSSNFKAV